MSRHYKTPDTHTRSAAQQKRLRQLLAFLVVAATSFLVVACIKFPEPPADDEGHASFARQVIPMVLGRKPYGIDEVEVVADIAQLHDRATAIEMLMQDEAYIKHWADILVDLLRVPRDNQGGISVKQDTSCWGDPTQPTPDPAIAEWVRDNEPDAPGAPTGWNMTDLLYSSIALDNLSPLYKANLFPMSMRIGGFDDEAIARDRLYRHFSKTYLNRDTACLLCHNPVYSTSNKVDDVGNIVWRRTWTIPGNAEKALFGNYADTVATDSQVQMVMRGDVRNPVAVGGGIRPWGISDDCSTDSRNTISTGTPSHQLFTQTLPGDPQPGAKFGSLDGSINGMVSLWELQASLQQGITDLQDGYGRFSSPLALTPDETLYCNVIDNLAGCRGCHVPGHFSGLDLSPPNLGGTLVNAATSSGGSVEALRVVPNNTGLSEFYRRINSPAAGVMPPPPGVVNATLVADTAAWINGGAPTYDDAICSALSPIPDVDPDEAFAFLTATNLVDGIWMAMTGHRLTIDNSYSRTAEQRDALRVLTEFTFLPTDWSLSAVIKRVLSSEWVGRRGPDISQQAEAYALPVVLDTFVLADPSEVTEPLPHEEANGQGELVDRFRVNTVLRNVAGALGWKEPRRFPDGTYPSPLDQELGQYISAGNPGFQGISFQSLLALENELGLCEKTGRSIEEEDWIDAVVNHVQVYNTDNPDIPLTIGDVWKILKDRLIQDTTIEMQLPSELQSVANAQTEAQALVALFNEGTAGGHTLGSPATALGTVDLTGKLREACGVLIKSPEFLLTHVTPRGYSDNMIPQPPPEPVCLPGEPCGYDDNCSVWTQKLNAMGKLTACEDRSVRAFTFELIPLPSFELASLNRIESICANTFCGFLEFPRAKNCLVDPRQCYKLPPVPPVVEELLAFKGKTPDNPNDPGILVMDARDAIVVRAKNTLIRSYAMPQKKSNLGDAKWRRLQADTKLKTGDLLYLPFEGSLQIKHPKAGGFGVKPVDTRQFTDKPKFQGHLISITGSDAGALLDRYYRAKQELTPSELIKLEQTGRFESRGVSEKDWVRINQYRIKPEELPRLSVREIMELNEREFEAQHVGIDKAER